MIQKIAHITLVIKDYDEAMICMEIFWGLITTNRNNKSKKKLKEFQERIGYSFF